MTAHQYWRLNITEGNSATAVDIATLQMRATSGGADQCSGGTASASNFNGASVAANAFDGSGSTTWQTQAFATLPVWIKYAFAAPVTVTQIQITSGVGSFGFTPKAFDVQYSDDNSTWFTAWSASGLTNIANGASYTSTEGTVIPVRVTATSLEVLSVSPAAARVTAQSLEVLVATYEVRVMKGVGYAVITSAGDRIGLQKAVSYAVLNSGTAVTIRKALGYAVLFDTTWTAPSTRRRPVIAICG